MQPRDFPRIFEALTGNPPFPWQIQLYSKFVVGEFPSCANIPTGLGKTSIIAVWLIALAQHPDCLPRRLVYVVNRRTVVDQTTAEAKKLYDALAKPELAEIRNRLAALCALPLPTSDAPPLAISTLRGQFADNGEWCHDPSRPAIVVGTVDMIGSGLLFSRYSCGFKTRPIHAGFLAQDALLVHDEAHLEPSFQKLLESIVVTQRDTAESRKLRVIELTATRRAAIPNAGGKPFGLDENPNNKDTDNEIVKQRFNAIKRLALVALGEGEKLDAKLIALANRCSERAKENSGERTVLIFARSVETVVKVIGELNKGNRREKVVALTGTMRGKERDDLVKLDAVFQRFLPPSSRSREVIPADGIVFLVATSAGEIGVNLSADDLVCDLSTYESMAQRFGRVNRFGDASDCTVTVVHETNFDTENKKTGVFEAARERTLALLRKLDGSASPAALNKLNGDERAAAFSPEPDKRIATEIQFDAWALTSIREPIAARPPVAPFLHGEAEWQPPETHLAWRDERDFRHIEDPEAFLDDFPLKPAEFLRDTTIRVVKTLGALLEKRTADESNFPDAWVVAESGSISSFPLANFDPDDAFARLVNATLVLPDCVGGLSGGLFDATADAPVSDVSEIVRHETDSRGDVPAGHRLVQAIEITEEDAEDPQYLLYLQKISGTAIVRAARRETLDIHTVAVEANASAIAEKLLPSELGKLLVVAARLHDLGKNRAPWQRNLGNLNYNPANPETILAKSAPGMTPRSVAECYRHEFGSLNDASNKSEFVALDDDERDVVLHLVAAHHGRARPHFPADEIFDYVVTADTQTLATEVPRRFARLQKRFGRWGLAWLESLLRAADYAASAGIVAKNYPTANISPLAAQISVTDSRQAITPTATLAINAANPGHYFACCGLFELAAKLAPKTCAWFSEDGSAFYLADTPPLTALLEKITAAEIAALDPDDVTASPLEIGVPFNVRLDWWKTAARSTAALKVWAGTMECPRIACAMQAAAKIASADPDFVHEKLLLDTRIAYDPDIPDNKVEPFYFDANRGPNAHSRDVGFAANDLKLETLAAPAVELFTLIGLQRATPAPVPDTPRNFEYRLWKRPLPISLLPVAVNGLLPDNFHDIFRFESWFRTGQRKHKAFLTARIVSSR